MYALLKHAQVCEDLSLLPNSYFLVMKLVYCLPLHKNIISIIYSILQAIFDNDVIYIQMNARYHGYLLICKCALSAWTTESANECRSLRGAENHSCSLLYNTVLQRRPPVLKSAWHWSQCILGCRCMMSMCFFIPDSVLDWNSHCSQGKTSENPRTHFHACTAKRALKTCI